MRYIWPANCAINSEVNGEPTVQMIAMKKRMSKNVFPAALILALLTPVAQAMPEEGRFTQGEGPPSQPLDFQRAPPAQFQRRDTAYSSDLPRPPRLSPEERRQLRRDIHEAGRDIYPPHR